MTSQKKPKAKPLRYFFYRDCLCKKVHINRGNDIIVAFNYTKGVAERYVYSDVRRNGEQAFTTKQVCAMVSRTPRLVKQAINDGNIRKPAITYGLDEKRNEYAYYWREKDIMDLHEYLQTVHYGRPRKDGRITPKAMPSRAELRAMIRQNAVFYVKVGDEFVPTWKATNI